MESPKLYSEELWQNQGLIGVRPSPADGTSRPVDDWCAICHGRYMVVLRMGGVYTDSDVECRKPLDEVILPSDALVAGWEAEFPNATIARISEYTRKRQVAA